MNNKKIKKISSLAKEIARLRKNGKKIVFTNGCFDIMHYGHASYLAEAKKLGDILVVGVNSDRSVKRLKGPQRPVCDERSRSGLLAALESVDYVVIFGEDTPLETIKKIKPDFLVKGGDWKQGNIVGSREIAAYGGKTVRAGFQKGYSTTKIIEKIAKLK